jgi:hypothetical protein
MLASDVTLVQAFLMPMVFGVVTPFVVFWYAARRDCNHRSEKVFLAGDDVDIDLAHDANRAWHKDSVKSDIAMVSGFCAMVGLLGYGFVPALLLGLNFALMRMLMLTFLQPSVFKLIHNERLDVKGFDIEDVDIVYDSGDHGFVPRLVDTVFRGSAKALFITAFVVFCASTLIQFLMLI